MTATIHQAKTHLSKLIRKALAGEEVIIANRDKPLVRLEALSASSGARRIGGLKHWSAKRHPRKSRAGRNEELDFYRIDPADPLVRR